MEGRQIIRRAGVSTNRAAGALPLLKAGTMENVLAEDRKQPRSVVHSLKTNGAGGEFDQVWRRRWERLQRAIFRHGRRYEWIMVKIWKTGIGFHRRIEGDGSNKDNRASLGLYMVEDPTIELLLEKLGLFTIAKLHKNQIPVHSASHDHAKMANLFPPLIPYETEKIARGEIARNRRNAYGRTVKVSLGVPALGIFLGRET